MLLVRMGSKAAGGSPRLARTSTPPRRASRAFSARSAVGSGEGVAATGGGDGLATGASVLLRPRRAASRHDQRHCDSRGQRPPVRQEPVHRCNIRENRPCI